MGKARGAGRGGVARTVTVTPGAAQRRLEAEIRTQRLETIGIFDPVTGEEVWRATGATDNVAVDGYWALRRDAVHNHPQDARHYSGPLPSESDVISALQTGERSSTIVSGGSRFTIQPVWPGGYTDAKAATALARWRRIYQEERDKAGMPGYFGVRPTGNPQRDREAGRRSYQARVRDREWTIMMRALRRAGIPFSYDLGKSRWRPSGE